MRRELEALVLTARWMHAKDPLWFVPAARTLDRERISILLDFSKWLVRQVPGFNGGMSAAWEPAEYANGVDESQINWNVSLTW
jgi:hypothetical protein